MQPPYVHNAGGICDFHGDDTLGADQCRDACANRHHTGDGMDGVSHHSARYSHSRICRSFFNGEHLELAVLELLRTYDRASLPPDQQLSYDVYEWYLDDLVRGHEFVYADFPINGYGEWDLANRLVAMTMALPIADRQDAEDVIDRLSQTGVWSAQLLEGLRVREQAGVIPPKFLIEDALSQVEGHIQMQSPGVFDVDAIALYECKRKSDKEKGNSNVETNGFISQVGICTVPAGWLWQGHAAYAFPHTGTPGQNARC